MRQLIPSPTIRHKAHRRAQGPLDRYPHRSAPCNTGNMTSTAGATFCLPSANRTIVLSRRAPGRAEHRPPGWQAPPLRLRLHFRRRTTASGRPCQTNQHTSYLRSSAAQHVRGGGPRDVVLCERPPNNSPTAILGSCSTSSSLPQIAHLHRPVAPRMTDEITRTDDRTV